MKSSPRIIGQIAAWSMAMLLIGCRIGYDWVIVKYIGDVKPPLCWKLNDVYVVNGEILDSDLRWIDPHTGNQVHISGQRDLVKVIGGNFDAACASLGVDCRQCQDGIYGPASGSAP